MKKAFSAVAVISAIIYIYILIDLLFRLTGRAMIVVSPDMLKNYNYWNSINLVPFKTIIQYIKFFIEGRMVRIAINNLLGNIIIFIPAGFYLPFFLKIMRNLKIYVVTSAALIIFIEIAQIATRTGSMDIDDFILNLAGALIGFVIFTRTPARLLLRLRAW